MTQFTDTQTCNRSHQVVTVEDCENGYVDATSHRNPDHPCYGCQQGKALRKQLASEVDWEHLAPLLVAVLDARHEQDAAEIHADEEELYL